MKSDRSVVVLHHFGLSRTIGFQAAVSDTSVLEHPESSHQLIVRSRCPRSIVTYDRQDMELVVECQVLITPYPF